MHRSPNKIFASLLAILLVIAPLPSILDAVAVSSDDDANSHAMMNLTDNSQNAAMSEMAEESDSCKYSDHCHGEGCAFGHCVSCASNVITSTFSAASTPHEIFDPQLAAQFSTHNFFSLFRPPKA